MAEREWVLESGPSVARGPDIQRGWSETVVPASRLAAEMTNIAALKGLLDETKARAERAEREIVSLRMGLAEYADMLRTFIPGERVEWYMGGWKGVVIAADSALYTVHWENADKPRRQEVVRAEFLRRCRADQEED